MDCTNASGCDWSTTTSICSTVTVVAPICKNYET